MTRQQNDRRSNRLPGYDYSQNGYYSVTICTNDKKHLFGHVVNKEMVLSKYGEIVQQCWEKIPEHFPNIEIDEFQIMPNHVHGIIHICRGTACRAPTKGMFGKPLPGSLSTIIRSFKSAVTRQINQSRNTPGTRLWQRNFYEHVIRNEKDLLRIREYIISNPENWDKDEYNTNM